VRKADNLPPSCAVVTKCGSLNFLEPSGPAQACNGTALPLRASLVSADSDNISRMDLILYCLHVILLTKYLPRFYTVLSLTVSKGIIYP